MPTPTDIDMIKIENHARALRAQALREMIAAFKLWIAGAPKQAKPAAL